MRLRRLLPVPERDGDGLPVVGRLERRLALWLTALATTWFVAAAAWGLFGPLLAGHYAASASVGIAADNMLRFGIIGPVWRYTATVPRPAEYYCHHPWGIFWTTAGLMKLFGRHDFVCRLPAVLLSGLTPPLLYLLGRAIWRPAAGAVAAAAFVVLPITLSFANFNALEVPVIAYSLLGLWGYVRHNQTWRRRYLATSVAGFTLALHADWPAYVLLAVLLAFGLLHGIVLRRFFGAVRWPHYARWWALTAAAAVLTLSLYLYLFHQSGGLGDLLASYALRARGRQRPLGQVLAARRYWLELSFTPLAIALGKVAAAVCAVRLLLRRDPHELVALAVLAMAAVQYLAFPQGADIHVYWPHYFGAFFALGLGALAATAISLGELVARRRTRQPGATRVVVVMAAALTLLLPVLRDGVEVLAYARATGGRFNEKGLLIASDGDKIAVLRWLAARLPADATVSLHPSMKANWSQIWALGGRVVAVDRPVPAPGRGADAYLLDTRFTPDRVQARAAAGRHVMAVGPFWILRRDEPAAPIDAYRLAEREPDLLAWYLRSGTEPVRRVAADPYRSWALRQRFGEAGTPPPEPPHGFEQLRIAHNMALVRGATDRAAALRRELLAAFDGQARRLFGGIELLGWRLQPGVRPLLTVLLSPTQPLQREQPVGVRSRVIAAPRWSTTMADPRVREVGLPSGVAATRWRVGFIYALSVPIRKRPGTERFELYTKVGVRPPGVRPAGGARALPHAVRLLALH